MEADVPDPAVRRVRLVVVASRVIGTELLICLPADAQSCRIECVAYPHTYAVDGMFTRGF
jgi:hypothetical protein